ncbi:hypothetical protein AVEN_102634-1 [Araneus ventricosus]|uniref:Uncharacterized protein n=1 Tax=Araneus ventricosus TaxID=182803 RepID=A0A4Y2BJG6_ARAVE|nr:hypothetical protein AVEN_102634-1 [Araneus ventricosus]
MSKYYATDHYISNDSHRGHPESTDEKLPNKKAGSRLPGGYSNGGVALRANLRLRVAPRKLVLQSWCEVMTTSQQTCFVSGSVDYALLPCRKFAAKLPHQVCHDKLISRKIKLAASTDAIWNLTVEQKTTFGFETTNYVANPQ